MEGSIKEGRVSTILLAERAKCNFDMDEMKMFFWRFKSNIDELDEMEKHMNMAPDVLPNHHKFLEMTPEEQRTDLWKRMNKLNEIDRAQYFTEFDPTKGPSFNWWVEVFQGLMPGLGLHISMFSLSVHYLSNAEQKARWMPMCKNLNIIGCYAQTELGHGSNVAMLETTATFDANTDQFVINSPTITSTKYWPGDLGRFCSHAVVMARLIVGKRDYGT
jgi:acyl-CoA oxidase